VHQDLQRYRSLLKEKIATLQTSDEQMAKLKLDTRAAKATFDAEKKAFEIVKSDLDTKRNAAQVQFEETKNADLADQITALTSQIQTAKAGLEAVRSKLDAAHNLELTRQQELHEHA